MSATVFAVVCAIRVDTVPYDPVVTWGLVSSVSPVLTYLLTFLHFYRALRLFSSVSMNAQSVD